MRPFHEILRRGRHMAVPILGTLFVCYFVWHAFNGDSGILAWLQIQRNIESAKDVLAETSTRRADMEKRVRLLKSSVSIPTCSTSGLAS